MESRLSKLAIAMSLVVSSALVAPQHALAETEDGGILVYHGKHMPVGELEKLLNTFLDQATQGNDAGRPVIVADAVSNSLLLHGEPEVVQLLLQTVAELDRKKASVFVEVVIVSVVSEQQPQRIPIRGDGGTTSDQVVQALSEQGAVQILSRTQLMTLDQQAAFLRVGGSEPVVVGVQSTSRGQTRNVTQEKVGMTLGMTCRVSPDGIVVLETDLERAGLNRADEGIELAPSGERAVSVGTLSIQTTLQARSGCTVVVGGQTHVTDGKWKKLVVLLTPYIIP